MGLAKEEPGINDEILAELKVFEGEKSLQGKWLEIISPVLEQSSLKIPVFKSTASRAFLAEFLSSPVRLGIVM